MQTQPTKPKQPAAPGKKWVKVMRTEQTIDEKGYFVSRDVEEWEEVEDLRKAAATQKLSCIPEATAKS